MRQRKLDSKIIRVGDRVRIIDPRLFVRCGYPISVAELAERIERENRAQVRNFLASLEPGCVPPPRPPESLALWPDKDLGHVGFLKGKALKRIARGAALWIARSKGFGGDERQIFRKEPDPTLLGKSAVVEGIRFVKTGRYFSGRGSGDDYEPPFLDREQTHKILLLSRSYYSDHGVRSLGFDVMIEAAFVEKERVEDGANT